MSYDPATDVWPSSSRPLFADAQEATSSAYSDAADALRDVTDAFEMHEIKSNNTLLMAEMLDTISDNPWGGPEVISALRSMLGHFESPKNQVL